jgi:hypothetical protein
VFAPIDPENFEIGKAIEQREAVAAAWRANRIGIGAEIATSLLARIRAFSLLPTA